MDELTKRIQQALAGRAWDWHDLSAKVRLDAEGGLLLDDLQILPAGGGPHVAGQFDVPFGGIGATGPARQLGPAYSISPAADVSTPDGQPMIIGPGDRLVAERRGDGGIRLHVLRKEGA